VPERLNGAVSKTVVGLSVHRGFESLPLRLARQRPRFEAQALFVTIRTVEMHLTHGYQKLEISSRTELPDVLDIGVPQGAGPS
jgi:hypothetical protein